MNAKPRKRKAAASSAAATTSKKPKTTKTAKANPTKKKQRKQTKRRVIESLPGEDVHYKQIVVQPNQKLVILDGKGKLKIDKVHVQMGGVFSPSSDVLVEGLKMEVKYDGPTVMKF